MKNSQEFSNPKRFRCTQSLLFFLRSSDLDILMKIFSTCLETFAQWKHQFKMESWNWQPTNCINNLKTCRSNDLPVVTLKWLKKISKEIARELMKIFPYQIPQDLVRLIVMKFILTSEVGNELNISFKKCCIIQSSLTEKFSSNGSTHKFLVECVKNKFKSRSKKISDCGLWPTKRYGPLIIISNEIHCFLF